LTVHSPHCSGLDSTLSPLLVLRQFDRIRTQATLVLTVNQVEATISKLGLWNTTVLGRIVPHFVREPRLHALIVGTGAGLRRSTFPFVDTVLDVVALARQFLQFAQICLTFALVSGDFGAVCFVLHTVVSCYTITLTQVTISTPAWFVPTLVKFGAVAGLMALPSLLFARATLTETVAGIILAGAVLEGAALWGTAECAAKPAESTAVDDALAEFANTSGILNIAANRFAVSAKLTLTTRLLT